MSIATARSKINTLIDGVSSVGTVVTYQKRVNEMASIKSNFVANSTLNTWIIKYAGSEYEFDGSQSGYQALRRFEIWGLLAVDADNSNQVTLDNITEDVEAVFANARGMSNNSIYTIVEMNVDMDVYEFAGILCNRAVLMLKIREQVEYA